MNREANGTTHTGLQGVRTAGIHSLQEAQTLVLRDDLSGTGPLVYIGVTVNTLGRLSF